RKAQVKDIETALLLMREHGIDQVLVVHSDTAALDTANAVSPGLNEPHFISPFSVKTDARQLGIAGWTSTNPNVRQAIPCRGGETDRSDRGRRRVGCSSKEREDPDSMTPEMAAGVHVAPHRTVSAVALRTG